MAQLSPIRRTSERVSLAALSAVLLVLAAFAVTTAYRTNAVARTSRDATLVSDGYGRARYALLQEASLEQAYRLAPGPDIRRRHAAAGADFLAALAAVDRYGGADDRADAPILSEFHTSYLLAVDRLFAAVDAHDAAGVLAIDGSEVRPIFSSLELQTSTSADAHRLEAITALAQLRRTERIVLYATPAVFCVGLALVVFFGVLVAGANRRLREQAEQHAHDASHDPLTGLPNRLLFGARLQEAIAAAPVRGPFAVMLLDLDRFKEINDTFGHGTGDVLLRAIGARLERMRRPGDTLARLGGDEFALLVQDADGAAASELGGRLLAALSEPFTLPDLVVSIEAGIGIVVHPEHGADAETLLQRADVAMYLAKDRGRGKELYDPADDPYSPQRLALAGELRRAIAEDELELHYQPKFETDGLRLAGVEALVRWRHPEHGLLYPGEFIPLAEHTGAIRPLTLLVLRKAARQQRAWRAEGLDTSVAVNLSVANLLDNQLVDDLAGILAEEHMPRDRLVLELTESMVMVDPDRSITLLGELSAMGIDLAVDDFGTGHASLAYLRRLPIAELKVDRVFVRHLGTDPQDAAIVASTIALAHQLGLRVVAEGVEDAEALARLRALGCDRAQGFHLCRPVPAERLRHELESVARRAAHGPDAPQLEAA